MNRKFRLKRSSDFTRVRKTGKSFAHPLVVLLISKNLTGAPRIGVVAGRSIGGAVKRNRVKRQLRAIIQPLLVEIADGWDLIFLARPAISKSNSGEIQEAVFSLLHRAGLVDSR